jgi:hypothetical protein
MTIPDDVMNDLLTLYLADEASPATRALVDAYARQHPAVAARLAAARGVAVPEVPMVGPAPDSELRALTATRHYIRLRTVFVAGAVLFTLMPFAVRGGDGGVEFLILGKEPGLAWASWSLAAASWVAWVVMRRRLRVVGL